MRKQSGGLCRVAAGLSLETLADALVQLPALFHEQGLIGNLLGQALAKAEFIV